MKEWRCEEVFEKGGFWKERKNCNVWPNLFILFYTFNIETYTPKSSRLAKICQLIYTLSKYGIIVVMTPEKDLFVTSLLRTWRGRLRLFNHIEFSFKCETIPSV